MKKILPMNQQQEVHHLNDSNFGEADLPQYVIVVVVGHDIPRVGYWCQERYALLTLQLSPWLSVLSATDAGPSCQFHQDVSGQVRRIPTSFW